MSSWNEPKHWSRSCLFVLDLCLLNWTSQQFKWLCSSLIFWSKNKKGETMFKKLGICTFSRHLLYQGGCERNLVKGFPTINIPSSTTKYYEVWKVSQSSKKYEGGVCRGEWMRGVRRMCWQKVDDKKVTDQVRGATQSQLPSYCLLCNS